MFYTWSNHFMPFACLFGPIILLHLANSLPPHLKPPPKCLCGRSKSTLVNILTLVNNFDLWHFKYSNELIFLNTLLNHLHWFWTLYNHEIYYIFLPSIHIQYFQYFRDVRSLETVQYEVPNSWTVHLFFDSFIALTKIQFSCLFDFHSLLLIKCLIIALDSHSQSRLVESFDHLTS